MQIYKISRGATWPAVVLMIALMAFGVYFFFRSMSQMSAMEREAAAPPPVPTPPSPPTAPMPEEPTYALRLRDLEGRAVSMEQFQGKPVFLTFWATWCRFCSMQMPSIQKLHDSLRGEGVVFLMVSSESSAQVKPFLEKHRYSLPVLLQEGPLPPVYQTNGIPATFILDKKGKIALQQTGARNWDDDQVRELLRGLGRS